MVYHKIKISKRLKDIIIGISKDFQVNIIEQESDKDHIHILFKTKADKCLKVKRKFPL